MTFEPHFWIVGNDGIIRNGAKLPFQPYVGAIVSEIEKAFSPSIGERGLLLLRGSMAIGKAVQPYSDIDLLLFTDTKKYADLLASWAQIGRELEKNLCSSVDLIDLQIVDVFDTSPARDRCFVHASIQSVAICGSMPIFFPPVTLSSDLFRTMWGTAETDARNILFRLQKGEEISWGDQVRPSAFWVRWIARDALRATASRIGISLGIYTSHLDACAHLISMEMPECKHTVDELFLAERFPPKDDLAPIERSVELFELGRIRWPLSH